MFSSFVVGGGEATDSIPLIYKETINQGSFHLSVKALPMHFDTFILFPFFFSSIFF